MQKVAGGDDCFLSFQKGTVTVNHRDGSTNTEEAMLYQCNLCDDGEVNKCDKGHGGSVRHVCQDKHLKNFCKLQVGDEVQETPNSLAWHQLPKAMTKYRKLNTTQHTAREAKRSSGRGSCRRASRWLWAGRPPPPSPRGCEQHGQGEAWRH